MGEKVSVADVNRARGSGGVLKTQQGVRGPSPLRRFFGSKQHQDWIKMDLNVAEIITVQEYKHLKD